MGPYHPPMCAGNAGDSLPIAAATAANHQVVDGKTLAHSSCGFNGSAPATAAPSVRLACGAPGCTWARCAGAAVRIGSFSMMLSCGRIEKLKQKPGRWRCRPGVSSSSAIARATPTIYPASSSSLLAVLVETPTAANVSAFDFPSVRSRTDAPSALWQRGNPHAVIAQG
jgi:hypothetical protein